jgi:hypothetical protein
LGRKKNELVQEEGASFVIAALNDFKLSLSDLSEVKISLTKIKTGAENVVTIKSTELNSFKEDKDAKKFFEDLLYRPIRSLNFKPIVKL